MGLLNSEENDETRHLWNLWMWLTESFCARSCGGLHKWVYDSQWRLKRKGFLHETGLVIVCVTPTAFAPNHWDVLVSKTILDAWGIMSNPGWCFVVKTTLYSSICVSRLVEGCEYEAASVGIKVTGNGGFCQVFPVLLSDWENQAQACLLLLSLGTKELMLGCQSTWLLSLRTVPISLICLLFPREGLWCNFRKRGGGSGNILPCFIDNIPRDREDVVIRATHVKESEEDMLSGADFGCCRAVVLLNPLFQSWAGSQWQAAWVTLCQEQITGY